MYFPVYDRALHEPALHEVPRQRIFPQTQIILTEGNYLLLDADPWRHLADVLDECWWVDTPVDQARQWIVDRHIRGGKSPEQAAQHYAKVDWPNTQLILNHRRAADLTISMKSH